MTNDLEETLRELGPAYRPVVDRLVAAYQPPTPLSVIDRSPVRTDAHPHGVGRIIGWSVAYLVAASLLVLVGVAVVFRRAPSAPSPVYTVRVSTAAREYLYAHVRNDAAVKEMIRSQRPDGSWQNDFLTRQNADALRQCPDAAAQLAYRKALRNMRMRGLL